MKEEEINIGYAADIMKTIGLLKETDMSVEELQELYYLNMCKNTYHTLMCKKDHESRECDFYIKDKENSIDQKKWEEFVKGEAKKYNLSFEELCRSLNHVLDHIIKLKGIEQDILRKILNQNPDYAPIYPSAESDSSSEGVSQLGVVPDSLTFVPDPS